MEMPVRGFRGQLVYGSQPYIVAADSKRELRLFTVKRDWSTTPKEEGITGYWSELSPKEVGDFSATAYFFGDLLQRSLDIPVGLIHCLRSASKIERPGMDKETSSQFPEIQLPDIEQTSSDLFGTPTLLWNAMVNPWKGFPVKGVIWYQGESNSADPALYKKLFSRNGRSAGENFLIILQCLYTMSRSLHGRPKVKIGLIVHGSVNASWN